MMQLLIRGLDSEGPGDIVGAFIHEADVAPEAIGNIEFDNGDAVVEVSSDAGDEIIDALDGGTIGRSTVSIDRFDERARRVRQYGRRYRELVELEREEEMRQHEEEIRTLSGREREARGRALLRMRGRDEGEALAGHLVKFMRSQKGKPLPETEIGVGDLVMISRKDPLRDDNPTGTVTERSNYSITVAFDRRPEGFVFGDGLRVDLYVNDVTFQRMLDAIDTLVDRPAEQANLVDIIVGRKTPRSPDSASIGCWHNTDLDGSQQSAVRRAVNTETFHLVHGPPGTGKTTTVIEAMQQCVRRGESVLATAAANTAVDNMVEFLVDQGTNALRIGHPARVTPTLHEHTLDYQIRNHPDYKESRELRDEAFDLLERQEQFTHPSGRWRRGMSNDQIKELADEGKSSRGVPAARIQEMARWIDIREEADQLFERAETLRHKAIDDMIDRAGVVCTTNATAGSELLDGRIFDTLIIDEATQATEPSCLIPITHGRRVIMAGDHRQLPPTVQSRQAANRGLRKSLFEKLAEQHDDIRDMLRLQYRMHKNIMEFSSRSFYDGSVRAAPSVRTHTLRDLGVQPSDASERWTEVLDPEAPLVFLNTAGLEAPERQKADSSSRENPTEADLVVDLVRELLSAGIDPADVAVISPYDDQVDRLRGRLSDTTLEIDTVDGFQGREKEVVFVSLVRSNDSNTVGFLAETRRFNVSITRAKRKLVVIGDAATVGVEPVYGRFVRYAATKGRKIDL